MDQKPIRSSGYTIIELMVNLAIIGILTAISISTYMTYRDKAKVARVQADLKNIHLAIEARAIDAEKWPEPNTTGVSANQEIWNLSAPEARLLAATSAFTNWKGPYTQSIPKDPRPVLKGFTQISHSGTIPSSRVGPKHL
jgi:prepilin-type N-terminal cleavage/methylation domain-containing protein